jgi:hypothetical protein
MVFGAVERGFRTNNSTTYIYKDSIWQISFETRIKGRLKTPIILRHTANEIVF